MFFHDWDQIVPCFLWYSFQPYWKRPTTHNPKHPGKYPGTCCRASSPVLLLFCKIGLVYLTHLTFSTQWYPVLVYPSIAHLSTTAILSRYCFIVMSNIKVFLGLLLRQAMHKVPKNDQKCWQDNRELSRKVPDFMLKLTLHGTPFFRRLHVQCHLCELEYALIPTLSARLKLCKNTYTLQKLDGSGPVLHNCHQTGVAHIRI